MTMTMKKMLVALLALALVASPVLAQTTGEAVTRGVDVLAYVLLIGIGFIVFGLGELFNIPIIGIFAGLILAISGVYGMTILASKVLIMAHLIVIGLGVVIAFRSAY